MFPSNHDLFMRLPAVPPALGLAAGIVLYVSTGMYQCAMLIAGALAVILYIRGLRVASIVMAAFVAGVFSARFAQAPVAPDYCFDGTKREYSGIIERRDGRAASQVCDVRICGGFLCRVVVGDITPALRVGDSISFAAALERLDTEADISGIPPETVRLRSRGYSAKALVRSGDCRVTGEDCSFIYRIRRLSEDIAYQAYASPLAPSASRLIVAATLGDSSAAPAGSVEQYRAAGIAHLLCVSGFHVGVVAALLAMLFYPLRLWSRGGRVRYILAGAGVWFYAVMTGLQPPVLRASVMISVFLFAALLQRRSDGFNALALAVAIILFVEPYSLFSIGFLLSVTAVLGLLLFAGKLNPVSPRHHRRHVIVGLVTSSVAATLGSLPVLLYAFHRLPPLFVVANVVGMLLFPPLLVGGWIVAGLSAVGLDMRLPARAVDFLAGLLDSVAGMTASYSHPALEGIYMTATAIVLLITAIGAFAVALYSAGRQSRLLSALLSAALFVAAACEPRADAVRPCVRRTGDIVVYDDKIVVCPDSTSDGLRWPERADYMLLDREADAFAVESLLRRCRPDTLLLDQGLTKGRRKKAVRAAEDAGVPVRTDFRRLPL